MKKIGIAILLALVVISAQSAYANNVVAATDVAGTMTVDNHYKVYISTDDSTAGIPFGQSYRSSYGDSPMNDADDTVPYDWATPESWDFYLTPGVTNYLHIEATDTGVVAGFLGQFTILNSNYKFASGSSLLLTGLDGWTVRSGGFDGSLMDLTGIYKNGEGVWSFAGAIPGINPDARWIWTNNGNDIGSPESPMARYFSAEINPVPEPISAGLFLLGGGALAVIRRKKA